ncbi:hypothetical protein NDU88_005002 [Pleurodeles waltl]|uniref:Uncharacterized protein n=1 Tax=Pleurodeles waltl TaxID=8319 RepID=A0AAV7QDH4_PLEWA|nr:hypothetical protein NDU88_005002 [Pleurodeles waltl]
MLQDRAAGSTRCTPDITGPRHITLGEGNRSEARSASHRKARLPARDSPPIEDPQDHAAGSCCGLTLGAEWQTADRRPGPPATASHHTGITGSPQEQRGRSAARSTSYHKSPLPARGLPPIEDPQDHAAGSRNAQEHGRRSAVRSANAESGGRITAGDHEYSELPHSLPSPRLTTVKENSQDLTEAVGNTLTIRRGALETFRPPVLRAVEATKEDLVA